jgi:hypothetical protein
MVNKKLLEKIIAYFPLIRHRSHGKDASNNYFIVACVSVAAVTFFI